jgi:hypothetical protein
MIDLGKGGSGASPKKSGESGEARLMGGASLQHNAKAQTDGVAERRWRSYPVDWKAVL